MTRNKHLKQLVRSRMSKTGEGYASARRQIVQQASDQPAATSFIHFPGTIPGAVALRILSANAGVIDRRTGRPVSEAMAFGIAGGIGAGVFAFQYEKEDFSSFFVAGRHRWQDEKGYLELGAGRMGLRPTVAESGAASAALTQLQGGLENGPVVAWVDMANLPYRAMPSSWSGGGYHIVIVYEANEAGATIGDLADQPFRISLKELATARSRIKKDKHRILSVSRERDFDLRIAVIEALQACATGLTTARQTNFTLKAFSDWADRLEGSKGKEAWERVFPIGHRLWQGLRSIHDFIEHYGTGGGLMRPIFADFLREAGTALKNSGLETLAERYAMLGQRWSDLAAAALPDQVPLFQRGRDLLTLKAELLMSGGSPDEIRAVWDQLGSLTQEMQENFPLNSDQAKSLRRDLQGRVREIYQGEVSALGELREWLSQPRLNG